MTFSKGESSVLILAQPHPGLVSKLVQSLGEPIDSYWNGSHTWFTEWNELALEWRLHPVSGFTMPDASRPEELLDLALESEVDPDHYWEGVEVFSVDEVEENTFTPEQLAEHVHSVLDIAPDAFGYVDHDAIGNQYEHNGGKVSIVELLLEQLRSK